MTAPVPSGVRIRGASLDDVAAAAAVARACDLADIGELNMHEEWIHDEWTRPRFDPSTDAWIVSERGGGVVAFAYTWDEEPHVLFDSAGYVHPEHRRRGIGSALVDAVERRANRDRSLAPAGSAIRVQHSFDADASGVKDPDVSGARALFERLGYQPERQYLHMAIDVDEWLPSIDPPAGIVIRPRVEADDRAIVAVMAEAFNDPWDYEDARREFRTSKTHDPSLWLIALDGDEAVGALFGYVANGRGQISALGVRNLWRRRGVGLGLLRSAFVRFLDRGVSDVRLNVDRENASRASRLYERAGMRLRRRWLVVSRTFAPQPPPSR